MIAPDLIPGWEALAVDPDWGLVLGRCGLLFALAIMMAWLATRSFRAYQRSR